MEAGHGGRVGRGRASGAQRGQGRGVEAGREERRPHVGQQRVRGRGGERLPGAGDQLGERGGVQGALGEQRPGELGGHQRGAGSLEWLPDGGGHVAQAGEWPAHAGGQLTRTRRGEPGHGAGGAVGGVRVAVRTDLLILPPLGAPVLEPDLQQKTRMSKCVNEFNININTTLRRNNKRVNCFISPGSGAQRVARPGTGHL